MERHCATMTDLRIELLPTEVVHINMGRTTGGFRKEAKAHGPIRSSSKKDYALSLVEPHSPDSLENDS